jgi:hypothetical protein
VKDVKDFNDGLYNITLPAKERRWFGMAVLCAIGIRTQNKPPDRLQDIEPASVTHGSNTIAEPYHSLHMIAEFRLRVTSLDTLISMGNLASTHEFVNDKGLPE